MKNKITAFAALLEKPLIAIAGLSIGLTIGGMIGWMMQKLIAHH